MRRFRVGSALLGLLLLTAAPGNGEEIKPCTPTDLASPAPTEPSSFVPCVGGFAGIYPCNNVDLMSHLPLASMDCAGGNSI